MRGTRGGKDARAPSGSRRGIGGRRACSRRRARADACLRWRGGARSWRVTRGCVSGAALAFARLAEALRRVLGGATRHLGEVHLVLIYRQGEVLGEHVEIVGDGRSLGEARRLGGARRGCLGLGRAHEHHAWLERDGGEFGIVGHAGLRAAPTGLSVGEVGGCARRRRRRHTLMPMIFWRFGATEVSS